MSMRARVAGVDFSGARTAGKSIWIAEGSVSPDGILVDGLTRAAELPGGAVALEPALAALVDYVATLNDAVVGFDFPFSIPAALIAQPDWPAFVQHFAGAYPDPGAFRTACSEASATRELKRRTDVEARVPWCAYNLRLYRQTWAGIRHVLWPLVEGDRGRAIPMQNIRSGLPAIAEVCPASWLKREGLYYPYKGSGAEMLMARTSILDALIERQALQPIAGRMRDTIIGNTGGDALDSVLAAVATARIGDVLPRDGIERLEGRVYF